MSISSVSSANSYQAIQAGRLAPVKTHKDGEVDKNAREISRNGTYEAGVAPGRLDINA